MNSIRFSCLVELFETAGFEVTSYSGRGMFGRCCLAVHVDRETSGAVVARVLEVALEDLSTQMQCADDCHDPESDIAPLLDLCARLARVQEDSMGMGGVVYWPGIAWEGAEEETDLDPPAGDFQVAP